MENCAENRAEFALNLRGSAFRAWINGNPHKMASFHLSGNTTFKQLCLLSLPESFQGSNARTVQTFVRI